MHLFGALRGGSSLLLALFLLPLGYAQSLRQTERVYASPEVKRRLAAHGLALIPGPPKLPNFLSGGENFATLTAQDFKGHWAKALVKEDGSCFTQGTALNWSSEAGEVRLNGKRVMIKGLNWYGMETDILMPQGLSAWSIGVFMDFLSTHRFNSIRLPFSLEWVLKDPATMPDQLLLLPELRGLSIGQIFDNILDAAAARGIIVLLDLHVLQVSEGLKDLWYSKAMPEEVVMAAWESLLRRVAQRWNVFAVDVKNEPHGIAEWASGDSRVDWNDYVERLIRRLVKNVPEWKGLFFVEGVENGGESLYPHWWGGNMEGVRTRPIKTGKAQADHRVVYSPHVYGPEVYKHAYFEDPAFPDNLFEVWDAQFGFIESATSRAMVVGEWGGSISTGNGTDSRAGATQQKLAEWMVSRCVADQYWWCLNPSTKHNGGMLGENYASADMNVLSLLDYVQPRPTAFHVRDDGALCVVEGSYANPRCALRAGLPLNSTQVEPHKP